MTDDSIANSVRGSLQSFQRLVSLASTSYDASFQVPLTVISEEEARFKVWSGNIGAHNSGRRSLQYRLRDASHLQKQIMALLGDLMELLEDALAIVTGDKVPWDRLEDDESLDDEALLADMDADDDELPTTEMAQISAGVSDVVNCLLRLSVAIRNPAPHDRFATFVPIEASHYEPFDIQHVKAKFGNIEPFLSERLGKAISRRRQYFKYRQSHHLKLSHGLDVMEQKDCESTIASSIPGHAKVAQFNLTSMDEDAASDSGVTQTSFASSSADTGKIRVPLLPEEAGSGPFECPFCYMMIIATSTSSWRRHVFADLRPYVCLSETCTAAEREFTRRHEWTLHEMQNHWKVYTCPSSCGKSFQSMSRCRHHITKAHPGAYPVNQLDAIISLSTKSVRVEDGLSCPMCGENLSSVKEYQRHVGRHQEQLALFALPSIISSDDADNAEEESISSESGAAYEEMAPSDDIPEEPLVGEESPIGESGQIPDEFDEEPVVPRGKSLTTPLSSTVTPIPSPSPSTDGLHKSDHHKIRPTSGDAVLVAHLDNGRDSEVPHLAGRESRPEDISDRALAARATADSDIYDETSATSKELRPEHHQEEQSGTRTNSNLDQSSQQEAPVLESGERVKSGSDLQRILNRKRFAEVLGLSSSVSGGLDEQVGFEEQSQYKGKPSDHDPTSNISGDPVQGRVPSPLHAPIVGEPLRGVLKQPTSNFPEDPNPIREGVSLQKDDEKAKEIPPGAKWTKISRKIVNPEALTIGKERFEVQEEFVIVLRPLSHDEIQAYADATRVLRERRTIDLESGGQDNESL